MIERKTKDGRSYWKIWSRKTVFPYEKDKSKISFQKGFVEEGQIIGSALKSISMFKNERGFTFVTYSAYLQKDKLTVRPDPTTINIRFKNGRTFVYKKSIVNGKKICRNITYSYKTVPRFIEQVMRIDGVPKQKILGTLKGILNIILKGAIEHKVLIKKPKILDFESAWLTLIFPCFQDFTASGYHVWFATHNSLQKKRDMAAFREPNIQECIRKLVGTKSKKLIKNIAEACRLDQARIVLSKPGYNACSGLNKLGKSFDTAPIWLAKILKPIMTLDHLQKAIEEYGNHRKILVRRNLNTRGQRKRSQDVQIMCNVGSVMSSDSFEFFKGMFLKNPHRQLQANGVRRRNTSEVIVLREFLKKFSPDKLIGLCQDLGCVFGKDALKTEQARLAHDLFDTVNFISLFTDTFRQWKTYKDKLIFPQRFKDIRELHDDISRQYRKIQDPDFDIPMTKTVQESGIDGWEFYPEHKLIVPKNRYTLMEWGEKMRNCIASYARKMADKQCLILGIVKDGILIYNIEVNRRGQVVQFYGKGNSPIDSGFKTQLESLLTEKGILGVKTSPVMTFVQANHHTIPTATNVIPAWDDAEELDATKQYA